MTMENKTKIIEFILVSIPIVVILIIIRVLTPILAPPNPEFFRPDDHTHYINMAKEPFKPKVAIAPFCYRILTPLIAWLLPFDLVVNFSIILFASFYLTGIILYYLLRDYFCKIISFTGIILFYSLSGINYYFYNIWLPDPLTYVFIVLCFWAIKDSKLKIYSLSLVLGVLTKEIVLFTIPVFLISEYFENNNKYSNKKDYYIKVLLIILPTLIVFIIVRLIIIPDPIWGYDYSYLIQAVGIERRWKKVVRYDLTFFFYCTISTWGILICLFPIFNDESTFIRWIRTYGISMCLIYCQLLIATDIERLLVAGFYPMILLTLSGMDNLNSKRNFKRILFLILSFINFTIQLIISILYFNFIFH